MLLFINFVIIRVLLVFVVLEIKIIEFWKKLLLYMWFNFLLLEVMWMLEDFCFSSIVDRGMMMMFFLLMIVKGNLFFWWLVLWYLRILMV